jgi:hypothetical protein
LLTEREQKLANATIVQDIVGDNYESLADAIRTVTGVDGEPDPYHGEYPLSESAQESFDELAANAWHTAKVSRYLRF